MATPPAARAQAALDLIEDAQPDLFGADPKKRARRLRELRRVDSFMREYRNAQRDEIKQMLGMMYFAAQSEFAAGNMDKFFEYGSKWLSYMTPQLRTVDVQQPGGGVTSFTWAQAPALGADGDHHDPV